MKNPAHLVGGGNEDRTPTQLLGIPSGRAGTTATLKIMCRLVRAGKRDIIVRERAMEIVAGVAGKDWWAEANACFTWVQRNIRYTRDINGVETVQEPQYTLRMRQGDCDDQSVLLAALLESIGHPCAFKAVGFTPDQNVFSHVYPQTKIGRQWVSMDPTENFELGWQPPGITTAIRYQC